MTYDEWIAAVFDHPVTDPAWYFKSDDEAPAELWRLPEHPEAVVQLIARTFQEIGKLPQRFSDGQIADGLNFIINSACSNLGFTLFNFDNEVNRVTRLKCIESIYTVYKELFALLSAFRTYFVEGRCFCKPAKHDLLYVVGCCASLCTSRAATLRRI